LYVMAKVDALSFRVDAEVKAGLERAAAADDRSMSGMAERILRAWLTEHGHMQAAPAPKAAGRKKAARAKP
jgi:predicted transcriptional regulator